MSLVPLVLRPFKSASSVQQIYIISPLEQQGKHAENITSASEENHSNRNITVQLFFPHKRTSVLQVRRVLKYFIIRVVL